MSLARLGAAAAALAAAALAAPAAAFVRTADRTTGVEISWPTPAVTFDLSSAPSFAAPSCAATAAGDPIEATVRASFGAWEQGCASLRLVYGGKVPEIRIGLSGSAENVVVIRRGWCSTDPVASRDPCMTDPDVDCGGIYDCFEDDSPADRATVALTTVLYDPGTGRVYDADMEVNGWDGQATGSTLGIGTTGPPHGYYFTCDTEAWPSACTTYGQDRCKGYDLRNTVTHEAGHFVGLAHPCGDFGTPTCDRPLPPGETVPYAQRTMYPATAIGETSKAILSADDAAGVCAIYPHPAGCGTGGSVGALAALLAALALRPAVRRRARPRSRPPGGGRR